MKGQLFTIHALDKYSLSTNYMPGTMPAAADPAENEPHTFPNFLVLQSSERRHGINKSTNTHKQTRHAHTVRGALKEIVGGNVTEGPGGGQLGGSLRPEGRDGAGHSQWAVGWSGEKHPKQREQHEQGLGRFEEREGGQIQVERVSTKTEGRMGLER